MTGSASFLFAQVKNCPFVKASVCAACLQAIKLCQRKPEINCYDMQVFNQLRLLPHGKKTIEHCHRIVSVCSGVEISIH